MEKLRVLVLSHPVTDALNGDGAGAKACLERFPAAERPSEGREVLCHEWKKVMSDG